MIRKPPVVPHKTIHDHTKRQPITTTHKVINDLTRLQSFWLDPSTLPPRAPPPFGALDPIHLNLSHFLLLSSFLVTEKKKPHIKKPLNAFMLYMKEMRAKVVAECTLKESAAINQILGRRVSANIPLFQLFGLVI